MKTIEFDYVDKEQNNTIIRAARANGMDAMVISTPVPESMLSIEGQRIPLGVTLIIGWESLDVIPINIDYQPKQSESIVQALDKIHQALAHL